MGGWVGVGGEEKKEAASIGGRSSGSSLICRKAQIPKTSPATWIQVGSSTSRHPKVCVKEAETEVSMKRSFRDFLCSVTFDY